MMWVFTFYCVLRYVARNGLSVHKDLDVSFLQYCRAPNRPILFQQARKGFRPPSAILVL